MDPKNLVVGFDADDTLWHNENIFADIQSRLTQMLKKYTDTAELDEHLVEVERKNLSIFGYGIKSFTLSMVETAIELTEKKIQAEDIYQILEWGKEMLKNPIHLLDNVEEVIFELSQTYTLALITKGELFQQESRIARSGLTESFEYIEILSHKRPEDYRDLLESLDINISNFIMIGNSLYSDVLPVVELGGTAIYIPYHITWELEKVPIAAQKNGDYMELENISGVPKLLKNLTQP